MKLEGLRRMHPRIVFAMQDEGWGAVFLDVANGASFGEVVPIIPQPFAVVDQEHFLGDIGCADFGDVIADPDEHDAGGITIRVIGGAPGGGVPAVGTARDSHAGFIHKTDGDQVVDSVHEINGRLASAERSLRLRSLRQTGEANFGFTGHFYHAPSGLHLALYRAYSSEWGHTLERVATAAIEPAGVSLLELETERPRGEGAVRGFGREIGPRVMLGAVGAGERSSARR